MSFATLNKLENKFSSAGLVKYSTNTLWLFTDKVLRLIFGFFVGAWVARYLGPEQYGLLNYALTFTMMFGFLLSLGLDGGLIVKELNSESEFKKEEIVTSTFALKLLGSFIAIGSIYFISLFIEKRETVIQLILISSLFQFFRIFSAFELYFESIVSTKYIAISNTIALIISSLLKIYLILSQANLISFTYATVLDGLIIGCMLTFFYIKHIQSTGNLTNNWKININFIRKIYKKSFPLMICDFLAPIFMQLDILMIEKISGSEATGNYSAAVRISTLFYFIPVSITSSLYPALINAKKNSQTLFEERFLKLFQASILFMLPVSIFISLFSQNIITVLYSNKFSTAGLILTIHIWSTIFIFFNNIQWKWYILQEQQNKELIRISLAALMNFLLNLCLIPKYGPVGAAIATLISYAFVGYFGNLLFHSNRKLFLLQTKAIFMPFGLLTSCFKNKESEYVK